jgi:hypothetical protein
MHIGEYFFARLTADCTHANAIANALKSSTAKIKSLLSAGRALET